MKILRTRVYIILSIGICLNADVAQIRSFLPSTSYWTRLDFLYLKSVHFHSFRILTISLIRANPHSRHISMHERNVTETKTNLRRTRRQKFLRAFLSARNATDPQHPAFVRLVHADTWKRVHASLQGVES